MIQAPLLKDTTIITHKTDYKKIKAGKAEKRKQSEETTK
jgi:hypothetical protein